MSELQLTYWVFAYSAPEKIESKENRDTVEGADLRVREILDEHPDWRCTIYPKQHHEYS